jgi:RNA polymerase subunit RPABC4/transcription elongation factor Spt4
MKKAEFVCKHCNIEFSVTLKHYRNMCTQGKQIEFCSSKCRVENQHPRTKVSCLQCGKELFVTASKLKAHPNSFCNRSCSATYNGRAFPKRSKQSVCRSCGEPISSARNFCPNCSDRSKDYTLGEVIYQHHHKSSAFALVRARARSLFPKCPCENCGYEKHTEVCHIKSISDFSLDTKLSIINDRSNLKRLCPNCHWEHDNL